jgi:hypothetical protein
MFFELIKSLTGCGTDGDHGQIQSAIDLSEMFNSALGPQIGLVHNKHRRHMPDVCGHKIPIDQSKLVTWFLQADDNDHLVNIRREHMSDTRTPGIGSAQETAPGLDLLDQSRPILFPSESDKIPNRNSVYLTPGSAVLQRSLYPAGGHLPSRLLHMDFTQVDQDNLSARRRAFFLG